MKRITVILSFFSAVSGFSQQDPMFTHYNFNILSVNPAYAGSRNVMSVTALQRMQWVGFTGAPNSANVNFHTPLLNSKLGTGFTLTNDKIGPVTTTGLFADIAARLKIGSRGKLSAGIKVGMNFRSSRLASLQVQQAGDPNFASNIQSEILPNVGFGLYFQNPDFYFGMGAPRLLRNKIDGEYTGIGTPKNYYERHFYFLAGGTIDLKKDKVRLRPSASLRLSYGAKAQIDLNAIIYLKEKIWFGPMFRFRDSFGLLGGMKITDQFSAGYSFDWSYGVNTGKYNGGSHELMLRYDFVFEAKGKIESPRGF